MIPTLLGITFLSFLIIQLSPGDYLSTLKLNPQISRTSIAQLQSEFGLDRGFVFQYLLWLKNIVTLNFGYSFSYRVPVLYLIKQHLCNTLLLGASAMLLTWLAVIPLGLICALKKNRLFDKCVSIIAFAGMSFPVFFLSLLALWAASKTSFWPLGGIKSLDYFSKSFGGKGLDIFQHLLLPSFILAAVSIGGLFRIMRSHVIEQLTAPYITVLRARGLKERRILIVHVLRNSLNPLITLLGFQLSGLLSGAAFVEIIFSWPGLGRLMLEAVLRQDLYLIMGNLLVSSFLLLLGNLLADIFLVLADPRIQHR